MLGTNAMTGAVAAAHDVQLGVRPSLGDPAEKIQPGLEHLEVLEVLTHLGAVATTSACCAAPTSARQKTRHWPTSRSTPDSPRSAPRSQRCPELGRRALRSPSAGRSRRPWSPSRRAAIRRVGLRHRRRSSARVPRARASGSHGPGRDADAVPAPSERNRGHRQGLQRPCALRRLARCRLDRWWLLSTAARGQRQPRHLLDVPADRRSSRVARSSPTTPKLTARVFSSPSTRLSSKLDAEHLRGLGIAAAELLNHGADYSARCIEAARALGQGLGDAGLQGPPAPEDTPRRRLTSRSSFFGSVTARCWAVGQLVAGWPAWFPLRWLAVPSRHCDWGAANWCASDSRTATWRRSLRSSAVSSFTGSRLRRCDRRSRSFGIASAAPPRKSEGIGISFAAITDRAEFSGQGWFDY